MGEVGLNIRKYERLNVEMQRNREYYFRYQML